MSDRLPTALWVDAHLEQLTKTGKFYYFIQKGNTSSGLVLLKLNGLQGRVRLLIQERDFMEYTLVWSAPMDEQIIEEKDADEYIKRAIERDPDLWALEIEDKKMNNPFE